MKKLFKYISLFLCLSLTSCTGETASSVSSHSSEDTSSSAVSASTTVSYSDEVEEGEMLIKFLNVGEADSTIILMKDYCIMIDAGLPSTYPVIKAELDALGITQIDALVITHFDKDHYGGAKDIVDNFTVGRVILGPDDNTSGKIEKMFKSFEAAGITPEYPEVGDKLSFGSAEFEILGPYSKSYEQENDYSLVGKLNFQGKSILFTGDSEATSLTEMLSNNQSGLKADILKVPHHGRYNRMSPAFISAVAPTYAIISSIPEDADNRVISALLTSRSQYYITGEGTVTLTITADGMNVTV